LAPCLAVKRGEVSFTEALALIDRARTDLQTAMDTGLSVLPDVPDRAAVDAWLISAHRRHWAENGL
jgi:hypothetical protein